VEVASADTQFTFTYSDGSNVANAIISASSLGGGQFVANSGTLNVTAGLDVGTYSLVSTVGAPPYSGVSGTFLSPSGAFYFDDLLFAGTSPFLDGAGLVFVGNGPGAVSTEINIWGNSANNYSFYSWNGSTLNVTVDGGAGDPLTLISTPEPSSLALLGIAGFLGVCWHFRKLKQTVVA
jgi:hypothetical protein